MRVLPKGSPTPPPPPFFGEGGRRAYFLPNFLFEGGGARELILEGALLKKRIFSGQRLGQSGVDLEGISKVNNKVAALVSL